MEIIDYNDIDFKSLNKFNRQGNSSDLYENNGKLIKIFRSYSNREILKLYKKLEDMDNIKIDGIIKPDAFIVRNYMHYGEEKHDIKGYTMYKFSNSESVNEHFAYLRSYNCSDLFKVLKKASLILQNIHNNDIICQDISFFNILVDKDDYDNVKVCDLDACSFKKYSSPTVSYELSYYYNYILDERFVPSTKNSDKLSMILSLLYLLFSKDIDLITENKYESISSKIDTLNNLKDYFISLKNGKFNLHYDELPYLHELIDDSDDYVIENRI